MGPNWVVCEMPETILGGNRRVSTLVLGAELLGLTLLACAAWILDVAVLKFVTVTLGPVATALTVWVGTRPRLAYSDGALVVYLRLLRPHRIPIDVVEVFFLGQGPIRHEGTKPDDVASETRAANVVVRIAEAATRWHGRNQQMPFGRWKDGYVTLGGLWCEPLNSEVIKRANHRLSVIKRSRKQAGRKKG